MVENLETEVLGMLTLMDADSFTCVRGILDLDVSEQKKFKCKLLKYILMQINSEGVKCSDDGGSSWYAKLHDYRRVSVSKKF